MSSNIYWDGATATYAGPSQPSLPTPFWLDNSSAPYVLHYWLDVPDYTYIPLGNVDPATNTFTPSGITPAGYALTDNTDGTFTFVPNAGGTAITIREFDIDVLPDSPGWSPGDTLAKENAGGTEQETDADTFVAGLVTGGPATSAAIATAAATAASAAATPLDIDPLPDNNAWSSGDTMATENTGGTEQEADTDAYVADLVTSGPATSAAIAAAVVSGSTGSGGVDISPLPDNSTWATGDTIATENSAGTDQEADADTYIANLIGSGPQTIAAINAAIAAAGGGGSSGSSTTAVGGPAAVFFQQEPRGTDGGDIPGGGWRDRVLNTSQFNSIPGLSLAPGTGIFTVAASSAPRYFKLRGRAAIGFYGYPLGFVYVHHQLRIATTTGVQQIIGESSYASNQNGGIQSGNNDYANLEGVLVVPASGGSYNLQHLNSWAPSSWDSKQGEAVGDGMDLEGFPGLGGPEVFATLSVQEIS